jgi:hypothetical protein
MISWENTETALNNLRKRLNALHEIGEKNFNDVQKEEIRELRAACIRIGEIRYSLVRKGRA